MRIKKALFVGIVALMLCALLAGCTEQGLKPPIESNNGSTGTNPTGTTDPAGTTEPEGTTDSNIPVPEEPIIGTEGLVYELSNSRSYYYVDGYYGTSTEVCIPPTYLGLPVSYINKGAFQDCANLTDITIPDSVDRIGEDAFSGCTNLIKIVQGVSYVDNWAVDCTPDVTYVYLFETTVGIGDYAFKDCNKLTSVTFSDCLTSIGAHAFHGCSKLESITIPESVTHICDAPFLNCTRLSGVYVTDVAKWCAIDFYDGYADPLRSDDGSPYTYAQYHKLYIDGVLATDITIPEGVTSIGAAAFINCQSLTSVTISDGVTSIDSKAFKGCEKLTSISIPDSVTSIGEEAFCYCAKLKSLTIPDSVTSIAPFAFHSCTSLIETEKGVSYVDKWVVNCDYNVTSVSFRKDTVGIGDQAFCQSRYQCKMTEILLPDTLTYIGWNAFGGCSSLTSIALPNSVTSIGDSAFIDCDSLSTVYYGGTMDDWDNISINTKRNYDLTNATRYYYSETEPTDRTHKYWHYVDGVPTPW